ncbi:MAG: sulfite exporter TauE/SafE family protein [Hormoscilla sp. GM102CHS1]|nr:sulfite exporter TauE/SafE family protein [Hormoscilla sp. GM102CHS1]
MLELYLIASVGFLGSFGHCVGMCGPLTVAFSLSQQKQISAGDEQSRTANKWQPFYFNVMLNLGRIFSYVMVGAAIGAVGSVLIAGGTLAGIDRTLRRAFAIVTGLMLIWFGLVQIEPGFLPRLPILHPLLQGNWHDRLNAAMMKLSVDAHWWTPIALGMVWGLIPCGFLYAAQIKAAETGSMVMGAATMLAFGLGTFPMMLTVGVSTSKLSAWRRSQLYRLGGWLTLIVGCLTLLRAGAMHHHMHHAVSLIFSPIG